MPTTAGSPNRHFPKVRHSRQTVTLSIGFPIRVNLMAGCLELNIVLEKHGNVDRKPSLV